MASSSQTMKSIGLHGQWGFSSTFDFVEALTNANTGDIPEEFNILLVGPGDIRHILCSLSKLFRKSVGKNRYPHINFYLLETPIEVLARDLVLLELFCDFELPVRQRATVFLEVFGNLKVQRRTNVYLELLSQRLRNLMSKGQGILSDVLDFTHLGYRERDYLEAAFKKYDRSAQMEMDSWFDHRKRGLLEDRYDSRKSIYDWDYHSGVKSRASIVHIKQFKNWRETGIAYEFGDQEYVEPNKSFMTFAEGFLKHGRDKGLKKEVMGFWGDIVCSPYFAFGVDCDTPNKFAEGLFEIYNKGTGSEQQRHHAVEVALYQLFSFMWEVETSSVYTLTRANDVYSGLGNANSAKKDINSTENLPTEMTDSSEKKESTSAITNENNEDGNIIVVDEFLETTESTESASASATSQVKAGAVVHDSGEQETIVANALDMVEHVLRHLEHIKIFPLTVPHTTSDKTTANATTGDSSATEAENRSAIAQLLSKTKYRELFHGVFVSARYAQLSGYPVLADLLAPSSVSGIAPLVAVETAKFLVPLTNDVKRDFAAKIDEFACQRQQFEKVHPVFRRHRDENDPDDDVLFYRPSTSS